MSNPLRDFLRSHPQVIEAAKQLEHLGFDAAEDLAVNLVGSKLGLLGRLLPVAALADAGKAALEGVIDGTLTSLEGQQPPPAAPQLFAAPAAAPAAPVAAPTGQTDPTMVAKQAALRARQDNLATDIASGARAAPGQRFVPISPEGE